MSLVQNCLAGGAAGGGDGVGGMPVLPTFCREPDDTETHRMVRGGREVLTARPLQNGSCAISREALLKARNDEDIKVSGL